MRFTLIPPDCAPLGGGAVYGFEADAAADRTFRIVEAASGDLLGAKRFHAAAAGRFDIAPYLASRFRFSPGAGPTGFADAAGRSVAAIVETDEAAAPVRTFLAGTRPAEPTGLRTSMPRMRLLGRDECDELTLLAADACPATLRVRRSGGEVSLGYPDNGSGLRIFRLDAADFPDAEALALSFGEAGTVEYRIVERPAEAVRLAWVGGAGSIEHYTFPVEKSCSVRTDRKRVSDGDGCRTVRCLAERLTALCSAFETRDTMACLEELLCAPQVWIARRDGSYVAADLLTEHADVRRHGTCCRLEITIRTHVETSIR